MEHISFLCLSDYSLRANEGHILQTSNMGSLEEDAC